MVFLLQGQVIHKTRFHTYHFQFWAPHNCTGILQWLGLKVKLYSTTLAHLVWNLNIPCVVSNTSSSWVWVNFTLLLKFLTSTVSDLDKLTKILLPNTEVLWFCSFLWVYSLLEMFHIKQLLEQQIPSATLCLSGWESSFSIQNPAKLSFCFPFLVTPLFSQLSLLQAASVFSPY